MENILESGTYCLLKNIRTGIWIADMRLLCCPICDISSCPGSMLMLEARHIELFLNEGYQDGTWEYQVVGAHDIKENTEAVSGAILDVKHLKDSSTSGDFSTSFLLNHHCFPAQNAQACSHPQKVSHFHTNY
ncbi:probable F-box protein At3g61730 [Syzygium oleosum]|uniref:probable F-box protein At3g61730 n=1 Tax=Syzygium oleosum TaxID=219896 RepID=UPI0024B98E6F|nr:probable F-box protein At3g61730 [Syzygium oleosum]